jgi:hypothetical protein
MSVLHDFMHFVRWRLIALRYTGKIRWLSARKALSGVPPRTVAVQRILNDGHDSGPTIPPQQMERITAIYGPRTAGAGRRDQGHPFVNLFRPEDIVPENPVLQLAFSPAILDLADDYFAGHIALDSIQVLYSWPTEGELRESQMWHKDYGDSKSFHWIAYLNDVEGPEDGPFAFIDKADTKRISRSAFIRRIADQTFTRELGNGQMRQFLGKAGESIFVDPASCYHSGSRCKNARLAIFVTFNTDRPFVSPVPVITQNRDRIADVAKQLRPDLSDLYLRRLLQLH